MVDADLRGIAPAAITGRVAITDDEQAESSIGLLDPDGRLRDAVRKGARVRRPENRCSTIGPGPRQNRRG